MVIIDDTSKLCLQNRWRLEGNRLRYYGIRNKPFLLKNVIRLKRQEKKSVVNLLM